MNRARDPGAGFRQMLDLAAGRSIADLVGDRTFSLALTRLLEMLGEAARRMSPEIRERYPELPWRGMIGMRDWLVHGYDELDPAVIWDSVSYDLEPLIDGLKQIIQEWPPDED